MKFICMSDIHLVSKNPKCRLDNLFRTQFQKLEFVLDFAQKNNAIVLQAGDFFNDACSIRVLSEFINLKKRYSSVKIYTVYGQHDMLYRNKKHTNASICNSIGYLNYIDDDVEIDGLKIRGCDWNSNNFQFNIDYPADILIIHAPIAEKALYPNHDYLDARTFLGKHPYKLIICGDIHNKPFCIDINGRKIVNSGPMNRISKDLYDHKPGFWVWDSKTFDIEWVEISHEPSEKVINTSTPEFADKNIFEEFIKSVGRIEIDGIDVDANLEKTLLNVGKDIADIIRNIKIKCEL